MGSIRRLRLVQIISLVVWIGSVALFASAEGPLRSLWMVLWIVAFVVFQVAFWRSMWLVSQPRMPRDEPDADAG